MEFPRDAVRCGRASARAVLVHHEDAYDINGFPYHWLQCIKNRGPLLIFRNDHLRQALAVGEMTNKAGWQHRRSKPDLS
jgi:hypothetical protein